MFKDREWFYLLERLRPELYADGLNEHDVNEILEFIGELWAEDDEKQQ